MDIPRDIDVLRTRLDTGCFNPVVEDDLITANDLRSLLAEIARLQEAKRHALALADAKGKENVALRDLVLTLIDNDPYEPIADNGMTVLDGWRERARKQLGIPF